MANIPCGTETLITGNFNICLNGVDLGATTGELTITQENTWEDVKHGQSNLIVNKFLTEQSYMVTATMRSLTLDKLRVFMGLKTGLSGQSLCIKQEGLGCSWPEEFELTVIGPGPGCGCRNFHFPRVVITPDSIEYVINSEALTELEVEFAALPDCDGLIGCITDVCGFISKGASNLALTCSTGTFPNYNPPSPIVGTTGAP